MDYSALIEKLRENSVGCEASIIIRLIPVGEGHMLQTLVSIPMRDLEVPPEARQLLGKVKKEGVFVLTKDAFGSCLYSSQPVSATNS